MTNSRLRAKRQHAPNDEIEFIFLRVTNLSSLCGCSRVQMSLLRRGGLWTLSKANTVTRIPNSTYKIGLHSSLATSSWLYDGTHTGCTFAYSTTISNEGAWKRDSDGLCMIPTKVFPPGCCLLRQRGNSRLPKYDL